MNAKPLICSRPDAPLQEGHRNQKDRRGTDASAASQQQLAAA
ncbi:hypothetical protein M758_9G009600 [Ceratodon purpureus]|uniref:Uncharacterized protein n=1 Tax=Ceratodon purpureus TaxID=3225 RepID=A0A8T0GP07_CERPU|nr:hypothetical protein KC19_9G010100 [Ceratodon purpureus]KAG0604813.1 hypothetical protein M758_9G009600 [Ceratodon purpureus]